MKRRPRLFFPFVVIFLAIRLHGQTPRTFRLWVFSDAHVGSDKKNGRDSLAIALRQSEKRSGF